MQGTPSGLAQFGALNYAMTVTETANESLTAVMDYPIAQTFYICSWAIVRKKEQERQLNEWKRKH